MYVNQIWNKIERVPYRGTARRINPPTRFQNLSSNEAYCRYCGGDIIYKTSPYTSWVDTFNGTPSIASGFINYPANCKTCGQINEPHDRVYFDALDKEDGSVIEDYWLQASYVFSKQIYDEFLEEYKKDGHVTFILSR